MEEQNHSMGNDLRSLLPLAVLAACALRKLRVDHVNARMKRAVDLRTIEEEVRGGRNAGCTKSLKFNHTSSKRIRREWITHLIEIPFP